MFTHVDKPFVLGALSLKNRVFRSAHGTSIGGGTINEDFIAYHEARARGGVALTVLEVMSPHRSCESLLNVWDPNLPDAYPRLTARMHQHGMKVFQQINHSGANSWGPNGDPPWAPSDLPGYQHAVAPVPMTRSMIDDVVESYAETARRCVSWGADGIELHCAHGYLIAQFLSSISNRRSDDYGGTWENRCRFMCRVARAVRAAVPGIVVGARFSPEMIAGGLTESDNLRAARILADEGLIDYVSVSLGVYQTLYKVIGGMHEPSGYELETSETITRNIRIPTMVVGRIRTLDEADRIISSGAADLVGFTRATIADADLVRKSLRGQGNRVRPCIGCNQSCIGGLYAGRLGCAVNPAVGFESILGEERRTAAPRSRRILVVGAGPAGMEAARVARLRGHDVILAEAEPVVGGALRFAARAPTRHAFADLIAWQERELRHLGVELRLSTSIGIEDVRAEKPDCVIVATGSSPRRDGVQLSNPGEPIDGMDRVLSSWDVFSAPERVLGRTAVVIDDLGHYEAVAVAEHLATRGVRVTFVSRFAAFAPQMETSLMTVPALQRLNQYPFDIRLRTRIIAVDDDGVVAGPVYLSRDSHAVQKIAAETVVFVSHNRANRELYTRLAECGTEAHVIGDGNSPRFLPVAMREGHQVGNQV